MKALKKAQHQTNQWFKPSNRQVASFTYVQDDVVHAELRLLLQSSQGLRVLVAQVAVQGELGAEARAVVQSGEEEDVAPALVAPAVVG